MANSSQPHGISDGSCLNGGQTFPGRGSCSSVARSRSRSRFFSERPQPRLPLPKPTSPRLLLLRAEFDSRSRARAEFPWWICFVTFFVAILFRTTREHHPPGSLV